MRPRATPTTPTQPVVSGKAPRACWRAGPGRYWPFPETRRRRYSGSFVLLGHRMSLFNLRPCRARAKQRCSLLISTCSFVCTAVSQPDRLGEIKRDKRKGGRETERPRQSSPPEDLISRVSCRHHSQVSQAPLKPPFPHISESLRHEKRPHGALSHERSCSLKIIRHLSPGTQEGAATRQEYVVKLNLTWGIRLIAANRYSEPMVFGERPPLRGHDLLLTVLPDSYCGVRVGRDHRHQMLQVAATR